MCGSHFQQTGHQPSVVAYRDCCQLITENYFSLSPFALQILSRPVSTCSFSITRCSMVSTYGRCFRSSASWHIFYGNSCVSKTCSRVHQFLQWGVPRAFVYHLVFDGAWSEILKVTQLLMSTAKPDNPVDKLLCAPRLPHIHYYWDNVRVLYTYILYGLWM